jgi:hypothetical protein
MRDKTYLIMAAVTLVLLIVACVFTYAERAELQSYDAKPVKF